MEPEKPRKPIPPNRTLKQVWSQYLAEKEIAERLESATREERKRIYESMYDELFDRVPDHPRLTRRQSDEMTRLVVLDKLSLLEPYLEEEATVAIFAPGDCRFAFEVARRTRKVTGIDVSDQKNPLDIPPDNFELIVYDGYTLDEIEDGSIDLVFSDQLIEHLHPEDTRYHFELVRRILVSGGRYVFRTPHVLTGPHDISAHFSDVPEGLHLKEWTYGELADLIADAGYSGFRPYWHRGRLSIRLPLVYFKVFESLLSRFPRGAARAVARRLIPSIFGIAAK